MKRILSRPTALLGLLPVLMLCLAPLHARAAGAAAADVANGYAGEAMEKILANWAAPADRGKVRIVVRVDAEGKVERCGYLEKSASQALNDSVCGAVMKTADLGIRRFEDMMVEIQEGKADFAVLPIENSSAGAVTDNYDLLLKYDNVIVAETFLPVHHYLLGTPDAELSDVKRVFAHPQALMQSSDFLNQHKVRA